MYLNLIFNELEDSGLLPHLIIDAPNGSNFVSIPDFLICRGKKLAVVEGFIFSN